MKDDYRSPSDRGLLVTSGEKGAVAAATENFKIK